MQNRIEGVGYKLIEKIKEGRKVYYILEEVDNNKYLYTDLINKEYGTKEIDKFSNYFLIRTDDEKFTFNIKDIARMTNSTNKTITKFDNTLIDKKIIALNGFYYFSLNKKDGNIQLCSKEEYNNFWCNKARLNAFYVLQNRYYKGEITLTELQLASVEKSNIIDWLEDKYYFRCKKFKTNKENELYIDTYNLLVLAYGNNKLKGEI